MRVLEFFPCVIWLRRNLFAYGSAPWTLSLVLGDDVTVTICSSLLHTTLLFFPAKFILKIKIVGFVKRRVRIVDSSL